MHPLFMSAPSLSGESPETTVRASRACELPQLFPDIARANPEAFVDLFDEYEHYQGDQEPE